MGTYLMLFSSEQTIKCDLTKSKQRAFHKICSDCITNIDTLSIHITDYATTVMMNW